MKAAFGLGCIAVFASFCIQVTVMVASERRFGPVGAEPMCVAWSADGQLLAAADAAGGMYLWKTSPRTSAQILTIPDGAATVLRFSPDGRSVYAGTDHGTIELFNIATKKQQTINLGSNTSSVADLIILGPKGPIVAIIGTTWNAVLECSLDDHDVKVLMEIDGVIVKGNIASDGRYAAIATLQGEIKILDLAATKVLKSFVGYHRSGSDRDVAGGITALHFAPKHKKLVTGGIDGRIVFWDIESATEQVVWPLEKRISALALAKDGDTMVVGQCASAGERGEVTAYSSTSREALRILDGPKRCEQAFAISPDDRQLALFDKDNYVQIIDLVPAQKKK